jgi:hypothetical protein
MITSVEIVPHDLRTVAGQLVISSCTVVGTALFGYTIQVASRVLTHAAVGIPSLGAVSEVIC